MVRNVLGRATTSPSSPSKVFADAQHPSEVSSSSRSRPTSCGPLPSTPQQASKDDDHDTSRERREEEHGSTSSRVLVSRQEVLRKEISVHA
jgi:hypothetical protein